MKQLVQAFSILNLVAFVLLAIVTVSLWRKRRDRAALWGALCFAALGLVVLLGRVVPPHPHVLVEKVVQRLDISLLVVFPYLLYRFTRAFGRASQRLATIVGAMTVALVIWTFALPRLPAAGEARPAWFWAYAAAFLLHWTALSIVVAWRLWSAGRRQPAVARARMRMLAFAATALTLAIVLVFAASDRYSAVSLAAQVLATISAVAFLLGLAPPGAVRAIWRRPEQQRLQRATAELLTLAVTQEEVARRVLEPATAIVGARALAIRNAEGRVVAAHGLPADVAERLEDGDAAPAVWDDAEVVDIDYAGGSLVAWTSPYAPFFGTDELQLLRSLGAFTGVALDRVRLFVQEHEARVALERANEVQANFVALAAHELRTPVTSIHGFVRTLNELGDRLDDVQKRQIMATLEQQTERMVQLIEQLLDLSRLDADAIDIVPERLDLVRRTHEIAHAVAGSRAADVRVEVAEGMEAVVDPAAYDRILSNLITNAFRYGQPPVIVRAARNDRHLRVAVEDRGRGVADEFVPDLFERFARSGSSRSIGGTGLGLAIARAYARAHGGDLLYSHAEPHGARFELVIPTRRESATA